MENWNAEWLAPFDLFHLLVDAKCRNDKVQSGSGVINQASGSGSLSAMFWPERRCALNGFLRLDMIDARMGVGATVRVRLKGANQARFMRGVV